MTIQAKINIELYLSWSSCHGSMDDIWNILINHLNNSFDVHVNAKCKLASLWPKEERVIPKSDEFVYLASKPVFYSSDDILGAACILRYIYTWGVYTCRELCFIDLICNSYLYSESVLFFLWSPHDACCQVPKCGNNDP